MRVPYYYSSNHYPKGLSWNNYAELNGKTIGVLRGYTYPQNFHKAWSAKKLNAEYGSDIKTNLMKLTSGRIDLAWDSERTVQYYLNKLDLTQLVKKSAGDHQVPQAEQHIGLSKKGKAMKYDRFISKRLAQMKKSGELAKIIEKNYSLL